MNKTFKIMKYELHDMIRGRWLISYFIVYLLLTEGLFQFGGDTGRVALSLMNIVLLLSPLVTVIYGTMFLYGSREFIELLLCHPVSRKQLYSGLYLGFAGSLSVAFGLGISLPVIYHSGFSHPYYLTIITTGVLLTWVFSGLAFLIAVKFEQRVRGMGMAIVLWIIFAILYDGLLLLLLYIFKNYPTEIFSLIMSIMNPIDLARILILIKIDIAAMMGYTGAVFELFFGDSLGYLVSTFSLLAWILIPYYFGLKLFKRKDF